MDTQAGLVGTFGPCGIDRLLDQFLADVACLPQGALQALDDADGPAHTITVSADTHHTIAGTDPDIKGGADQPQVSIGGSVQRAAPRWVLNWYCDFQEGSLWQ